MGRPRTIVANNRRHLTKAEIAERESAENAYRLNRDLLQPFDYLSEEAKAEFEFVKEQAFWLDNLAVFDLNLYCFYFDRVTGILKEYGSENEEGEKEVPPEVIEMKGGDGISKLVVNPLQKVLKEYHSEMRRLSAKLGLSPIDRLRLAPPKKAEKINKFLTLIK